MKSAWHRLPNALSYFRIDLTAGMVRRTIKGNAYAMYAFNRQVPGPLIRVAQNATITIRFHHRIELPSSVHWHGVRRDNASDGVVGVTQQALEPGQDYTYTVHFPDAGIYWYHPHVREDIEQAMGLFGNMLVNAPETDYYSPANQEQVLVLSDLLMQVDTLGAITVDSATAAPDYGVEFLTLRANGAVSRDVEQYRKYFDKAPDKSITLTVAITGLPLATVQFMTIGTAYFAPVEWVDGMPDMNWLSTAKQVRWILRDDATGKENEDIDWRVKRGSVLKLRIFNNPMSFHPMQHPIHLHGQRMLVVSRDGVPTKNLAWKDTALIPVGSTVDLLIDASNPGDWMLHCHVAEHLGAGMMMVLHVE